MELIKFECVIKMLLVKVGEVVVGLVVVKTKLSAMYGNTSLENQRYIIRTYGVNAMLSIMHGNTGKENKRYVIYHAGKYG